MKETEAKANAPEDRMVRRSSACVKLTSLTERFWGFCAPGGLQAQQPLQQASQVRKTHYFNMNLSQQGPAHLHQ